MNATFVRRRPAQLRHIMCDAIWQAHGRLATGAVTAPTRPHNSRNERHERNA